MNYYCPECGHINVSSQQPEPLHWRDGHVCHFKAEEREGEAFEVNKQKAKEAEGRSR